MAVLELLATSARTRIVGPWHLLADDRLTVLRLCPLTCVLHGGAALCFRWKMEKRAFVRRDGRRLLFAHGGREYALCVDAGEISEGDAPVIQPENGKIALSFDRMEAGGNA